jgi:anti-sigma B factor antagonist
MEILQIRQGTTLVFSLSGRLDARTSETFEQQLLAAIAAGERSVLMNFSKLNYISSAGLRVLLLAAKKLQVNSGRIALCSLEPALKTVFDIAGFSTIFPIFVSQEEAIQGLLN